MEKTTMARAITPKARIQRRRKCNIRVTAGPFADLVGTLQSLDDGGRVRVLLDILGGKIPVTLQRDLVMPTRD